MKSIFNKMLILMIGISIWAVYLNREKIQNQNIDLSYFKNLIPEKENALQLKQPVVSKVYKWKDEHGELHFTNKPPKDIDLFEELSFQLDQNTVAPTRLNNSVENMNYSKLDQSNNPVNESIFQKAVQSFKNAQQIENKLQNRKEDFDRILRQAH